MKNFLLGLFRLDLSLQIVAVVGAILFAGYLGFTAFQSQQAPMMSPSTVPATQK